MSLQVWLPLNGTIKNQGLSDTVTSISGAVSAIGKMGTCYSFDGQDDYISINNSDLYSTLSGGANNFSMTFWIYHADSSRAIIFGDYQLSGTISFNVELTTSHTVRFYWGGSPDKTFSNSGVGLNTWTHIALTYNGSKILIYKNGELLSDSYSSTLSKKNKTSGLYRLGRDNRTGTTAFKGRLNDFRIYNHCLSAKEIKEISNGLILHLPFKDNGIVPFNKNLLPDSNVNSLSKYLGTQARYYENASQTSYTNTWVTIEDPPVPGILNGIQQTVTASEGFHSVTWYSGGTVSVSAVPYTMSAYIKRLSGTDLVVQFEYGKNPYVWKRITLENDDEWHQYSWTFIPDTASGKAAASGTTRIYCGGLYSVGEVLICGWKLERGSVATPWNECGNTFYDCSGFHHNGMGLGELTKVNYDFRYGTALNLNSTAQHVMIPDFSTEGFSDSYTISWWGNRNTNESMFWGFGDGNRLNGLYKGYLWNTNDGLENILYSPGTTTQVTPSATNTWNHWVMTGDGTTCKVYKDGELWGVAKTYKPINGSLLFINGYNNLSSYTASSLQISDFRIYATALSAEEIKELYNTSAAIDNKGNGYAREEIEDTDILSINRKGQFINNKVVESDNNTTAYLGKIDKSLNVNTFYEY